ncbi:hypothetical protein [Parachlamydia sp. AcF125]|uniref:hypothetical protein n=1 Tax=Parachlamydia sp. AcF125 TaxID=2795736 RepID=UPI001BCA1D66|nr:hypothetical protein [Parachlamydia sp. AcF125]MBS4167621.1 hypothetical protein [Parachlamydia sp. AcF125]
MGVDGLKGEVFRKIVGPSLKEEAVKEQAQRLGISEIHTLEEKNLLINSLVGVIENKIQDYFSKEEVLEKHTHLRKYKALPNYRWSVLQQTKKAVENAFPSSSDEKLALSSPSSEQVLNNSLSIASLCVICSAVAIAIFRKMG